MTVFFMLFGVVTLVGGLIGFLKAGSIISLVMGAVFGLLIVGMGLAYSKQKPFALPALMGMSAYLLFKFGSDLLRLGKIMPAGIMTAFSLIALLLLVKAAIGKKPKASY
jgi:uncharacterized membrane protein (UPF0136 family)